jgi:tetratricopeptide (TPR) repeat protein
MMNRRMTIGAGLLALAFTARGADDAQKPPFYRSYLVPGNPLDDKIRDQEKRVDADPGSASLRNDFGNLLAARRFPGEARKQYAMAVKLDRKNFIAAYNLGLLEETEGNANAAIDAYRESIKRKPGFPPSHFRIGRLYEKRGDTEQAIEHYAKALRIDSSMRDPRRNPLVADTRLLDRISLTNYERDLAVATLPAQTRWADESRFARTPVTRALDSDEADGARTGVASVSSDAPASAVVVPGGASAPAPAPTSGRPTPVFGSSSTKPSTTGPAWNGSTSNSGRPVPPPTPTPR